MIDKKKMQTAFEAFMANPSWKRYYEGAPSDACKRYIKFTWYRSKFDEPKDPKEFIKLRDEHWDALSVEDWQYIMDNIGNSPFRKVCKEKIAKLLSEK